MVSSYVCVCVCVCVCVYVCVCVCMCVWLFVTAKHRLDVVDPLPGAFGILVFIKSLPLTLCVAGLVTLCHHSAHDILVVAMTNVRSRGRSCVTLDSHASVFFPCP